MKDFAYLLLLFLFSNDKISRSLQLRLGCLPLLITLLGSAAYGASTTYSYDALNRLSQVTYADGTVIAYTYDPAGNRLAATTTGGTATPPQFTSTNRTTFIAKEAGSFTVTATGNPAPGFSATGLPSWASLNSTSGVLSGTPPNTNGAPFTINLTATNGVLPNATQTFALSVVNVTVGMLSRTGNQVEMVVTAATGETYTVQTATNLASPNWSTLLVTNPANSSFLVIDPHATNRTQFYRVVVGP